MGDLDYGRKKYKISNGTAELTRTSFTVKSLRSEDELAFSKRLLKLYGAGEGTIEVVFKNGQPDYAIITLE
jgi:hypothetical protein